MKQLLFISILVCNICLCGSADAEESLALAMQNESGKPLSGIGLLSQIDVRDNTVSVNDFTFEITSLTKFFTEENNQTTDKSFRVNDLVRFEANEYGEIVNLWHYRDVEQEYSLGGNANYVEPVNKKNKKDRLIKQNGVWKNF